VREVKPTPRHTRCCDTRWVKEIGACLSHNSVDLVPGLWEYKIMEMTERDQMKTPYTSYEEINSIDAGYILSVSDADAITDIPLDDINEFFADLEGYLDSIEYYDDDQPDWAQVDNVTDVTIPAPINILV
jgi:hypothetical protein